MKQTDLKGSTIPELLISMLILLIITFYCSTFLITLYKESLATEQRSGIKMKKLKFLSVIHAVFNSANKVWMNGKSLTIEAPEDVLTIVFTKDTVSYRCNQVCDTALFENLAWKVDTNSSQHIVELCLKESKGSQYRFITELTAAGEFTTENPKR